jgi:hypothetical protein
MNKSLPTTAKSQFLILDNGMKKKHLMLQYSEAAIRDTRFEYKKRSPLQGRMYEHVHVFAKKWKQLSQNRTNQHCEYVASVFSEFSVF